MKKYLTLGLILLSLFTLFGCAAGDRFEETTIQGSLYFDGNTMTFTHTDPEDILYQTGNPSDDFVILYRLLEDNPTEADLIRYQNFMERLYTISIADSITMRTLFLKTSSELKTLFESKGLTLTLNDIVLFNSIKTQIESFESKGTSPRIGKINYINQRRGIDLTQDEINALALMQDYYLSYLKENAPLDFKALNVEDFITLMANQFNLDETRSNQLRVAYDIIQNLYKANQGL